MGAPVQKILVTGEAPWEGELWGPQALQGPLALQNQVAKLNSCSGPIPYSWRRENTARPGEEPYLPTSPPSPSFPPSSGSQNPS